MDIKYIQKVVIILTIFLGIILFLRYFNHVFETPEDHLIHNPMDITMVMEGMETPEKPDTSIIMNSSDAFCEHNRGDGLTLNKLCKKLTQDNCNSTNCCVWASPGKCLAGGSGGPTFNTDENGKTKDLDYYYYKGKCYGNGCP